MYRKTLPHTGSVCGRTDSALKSVTIGIWVNVGSRDEQRGRRAFHFLEHMFFKGTRSGRRHNFLVRSMPSAEK